MPFVKGYIPTKEHIERLRISHRGYIFPEEQKKKISEKLKGKKKSEKHRIAISNAKLGSKNPMFGKQPHNWKGGITPINTRIRTSPEYNLWRKAVFVRDNYTCVWCGARNGNGKTIKLNADHIKPFAIFLELRFAIDNGRTLCIDCHKKTDTYGGRKTAHKTDNISDLLNLHSTKGEKML